MDKQLAMRRLEWQVICCDTYVYGGKFTAVTFSLFKSGCVIVWIQNADVFPAIVYNKVVFFFAERADSRRVVTFLCVFNEIVMYWNIVV